MLNLIEYIWNYPILFFDCNLCISVSVFNLYEEERQEPENWIPIGWIPNYYYDLTKRPEQGYECDQAMKIRLFHECFRYILSNWDKQTKSAQNVGWGDQVPGRRQTRFFLVDWWGGQQVKACPLNNSENIWKYLKYS